MFRYTFDVKHINSVVRFVTNYGPMVMRLSQFRDCIFQMDTEVDISRKECGELNFIREVLPESFEVLLSKGDNIIIPDSWVSIMSQLNQASFKPDVTDFLTNSDLMALVEGMTVQEFVHLIALCKSLSIVG